MTGVAASLRVFFVLCVCLPACDLKVDPARNAVPCKPDGSCAGRSTCVDGACVADPCAEVTCGQQEHCVSGVCRPRDCADEPCPEGLACVDGTCVSPSCEGVTCSGHGTCHLDGTLPACQCDAGYQATGLACVPAARDVCDGVTCSDHGRCILEDDSAACECDAGYVARGLTCIEDEEDKRVVPDDVDAVCDGTRCTAYYVDCSGAQDGDGTFARPFNSLAAIKRHSFRTGDHLYFKVNTTCTLQSDADRLQVKWDGAGKDARVIIGAYYGEGKFGLGGDKRPVIDGQNLYPGSEQAAVEVRKRSFVTVRHLRLQDTGGAGRRGRAVAVSDSNDVNIENCHMYRTHGCALVYMRVKTGKVVDNLVEESKYPDYAKGGAALEISAGNVAGATTNILVARNKVRNCAHESIGLYKKVTHSIIEHNVVRDGKSYFIYIDAGMHNIIRYNLVYESDESVHAAFVARRSSNAITVNNEKSRGYFFSGHNQIHGNFIAGTRVGIGRGCEINEIMPGVTCHPGDKTFNNTIIDTDANFSFGYTGPGDNIEIANNISWIATEGTGSRHVRNNTHSPPGVKWTHNLFHGGPAVTGNAATRMITGHPGLLQTRDWRSLAPDSLSGGDFAWGNASPAKNAGITTANFTTLVTEADFKASPIRVVTQDKPSGPLSVGAWMP